jgi:hypothetical protein
MYEIWDCLESFYTHNINNICYKKDDMHLKFRLVHLPGIMFNFYIFAKW